MSKRGWNFFVCLIVLVLPGVWLFGYGGTSRPSPADARAAGPGGAQVGPLSIHTIQGAGHVSPYAGQTVSGVQGVVTAVMAQGTMPGFFMQETVEDANIGTSEGIFVSTGLQRLPQIGDRVEVSATVLEDYQTNFFPGRLSVTRLDTATYQILAQGVPLPAPQVLGAGGRVPPNQVIDDDATGNVETSGTFDPITDGIDFYESLEGMRVQINDAMVIGDNSLRDIFLVGDSGINAGLKTERGGLIVRLDDWNPERIILDDAILFPQPAVNIGDVFSQPIVGVIDYAYTNFKLFNSEALPPVVDGGLLPETTELAREGDQLLVASYNVLNLDPGDPPAKFVGLADHIIHHLNAPDLIGLQEIQDNSGPADDGTVAADITYHMLIDAIVAAGGPMYEYREIAPENNADWGPPFGNIRVAFLFRTDRGLSFIDRPGGDASAATQPVADAYGVALTLSPGRIDPNNSAFSLLRKSLAGEFLFRGNKLIVINNHFLPKNQDDQPFGRFQPRVEHTADNRMAQAQVINNFVDDVLAIYPGAKIIVLGDLNDFHYSTAVGVLKGGVLLNLMDTLPYNQAYTFNWAGNGMPLDHILLSPSLAQNAEPVFDIVHVNVEFESGQAASDHDPVLALLSLPPPSHAFIPMVQIGQ